MLRILIVHGPNLNLLGEREPEIYGSTTLEDLNYEIAKHTEKLHVFAEFYQSNHEGALVDYLHANRKTADGVIINPGALTHYSYTLRDAIAAVQLPTMEVHLSDIYQRESFRQHSVIKEVCLGQVFGKGVISYLEALDFLVAHLMDL